ncbi:MAG: UDP-N-acetylglucosamine 2-epimerase, partial [Lentisphaeria bacterium]|nr:UDP-N-acetylglucosamine 2-epimerase [Lentisphaeria bacterium]
QEAAALGKPIILLRDETERPEIARMTEVIPTGIREEKILEALKLLLKERACEGDRALLGDGSAAGKIIEEIFRRTGENA